MWVNNHGMAGFEWNVPVSSMRNANIDMTSASREIEIECIGDSGPWPIHRKALRHESENWDVTLFAFVSKQKYLSKCLAIWSVFLDDRRCGSRFKTSWAVHILQRMSWIVSELKRLLNSDLSNNRRSNLPTWQEICHARLRRRKEIVVGANSQQQEQLKKWKLKQSHETKKHSPCELTSRGKQRLYTLTWSYQGFIVVKSVLECQAGMHDNLSKELLK
jgi:hypothetical protein